MFRASFFHSKRPTSGAPEKSGTVPATKSNAQIARPERQTNRTVPFHAAIPSTQRPTTSKRSRFVDLSTHTAQHVDKTRFHRHAHRVGRECGSRMSAAGGLCCGFGPGHTQPVRHLDRSVGWVQFAGVGQSLFVGRFPTTWATAASRHCDNVGDPSGLVFKVGFLAEDSVGVVDVVVPAFDVDIGSLEAGFEHHFANLG